MLGETNKLEPIFSTTQFNLGSIEHPIYVKKHMGKVRTNRFYYELKISKEDNGKRKKKPICLKIGTKV